MRLGLTFSVQTLDAKEYYRRTLRKDKSQVGVKIMIESDADHSSFARKVQYVCVVRTVQAYVAHVYGFPAF